jgi:hypothetical protein
MDLASINSLCAESFRALGERCEAVKSALPPHTSPTAVLSGQEGCLLVAGHYIRRVLEHGMDGVAYIESLLMQQVVAAVGKHLQPGDFDAYMASHARRLFRPAFHPKPLCFSVRRSPEHSPEGTLRLELRSPTTTTTPMARAAEYPEGMGGNNDRGGYSGVDASPPAPIVTLSTVLGGSSSPSSTTTPPTYMDFALNAETRVRFGGERHLHAWLAHRFGGAGGQHQPLSLSLVASTRQFSSFIVCVGRIVSPTTFEPTSAFVVADGDEMRVPLLASELPTPRAFKDAIASLSPTQAAFATSFRAMQLESTLFGVLVLHIKPALEALLKLTPDSLTKEVALTQDLQELLIKYHIPSDLLSYGGPEGGDREGRLLAVKGHVAAMRALIRASEEGELAAARREAEYAKAREERARAIKREAEEDNPNLSTRSGPGNPVSSSLRGMLSFTSSRRERLMSRMNPTLALTAAPTGAMAMWDCGSGMEEDGEGAMSMHIIARSAPSASERSYMAPLTASARAPVRVCRRAGGPLTPTHPAAGAAGTTAPATGSTGSRGVGGGGVGGGVWGEGANSPSHHHPPTTRDLTKVPLELDAAYGAHDTDASLRASIITPTGPWAKTSQTSLLAKPSTATLGPSEQGAAKHKAFDLLDALTRSGALPLENAALHVVMGATHRFEESLMDTLVKGNINPIEKVERSLLIMASTLHGLPPASLVQKDRLARLSELTPSLFLTP